MHRVSMGGLAVAIAVLAGTAASAADSEGVTFTKDVLPIIQENCVDCHRAHGSNLTGMIAPMALTNYAEVRPWSKAIKRAVADRIMPPWHASNATHGVFKNERTLTEEQIDTIVK